MSPLRGILCGIFELPCDSILAIIFRKLFFNETLCDVYCFLDPDSCFCLLSLVTIDRHPAMYKQHPTRASHSPNAAEERGARNREILRLTLLVPREHVLLRLQNEIV